MHKSNDRCVCVRKIATVTIIVVQEVFLDRPSLSDDGGHEDPENPENEETSVNSSLDNVLVGFYGKHEHADTRTLEIDKSLCEWIQQLLNKFELRTYPMGVHAYNSQVSNSMDNR